MDLNLNFIGSAICSVDLLDSSNNSIENYSLYYNYSENVGTAYKVFNFINASKGNKIRISYMGYKTKNHSTNNFNALEFYDKNQYTQGLIFINH